MDLEREIKNKKVLITGGAGFIGSNLVQKLIELNVKDITVVDNLLTGNIENIKPYIDSKEITFLNISIDDFTAIKEAMKGIDIVFHFAALGSVPRSIDQPLNSNQQNVTGFLSVLEAANLCGVKRLVFSSSSSVYGDDERLPKKENQTGNPLSPYAVTKVANELYAKVFNDLHNIEVIGLRYFNVFGPKQDPKGVYAAVIPLFISNLLKGEKCYINGDPLISRDFTYVENVLLGNLLAATTNNTNAFGKVYNIASGGRITLETLYNTMRDVIGVEYNFELRESRKGDIKHSNASIDNASSDLGFTPTVSFEEGLRKTIDWYKKYLKSLV